MRKQMMAALAMTIAATPAMAAQADQTGRRAVAHANKEQARELGIDARRGPGDMRGGPDGMRGDRGPGRGMGRPDPERMFTMMDANRDGSVSRAEFKGFHDRMKREHHGMPRGGPDGMRGPDDMRGHDGRGPDGRGPDGRGPGMQRPDVKPPKR